MASTRIIALAVGVLALAVAGLIISFGGVHEAGPRGAGPSSAATRTAAPVGPPGARMSAAATSRRPDSMPATTHSGGSSEILPDAGASASGSGSGYSLPPLTTAEPAPLLEAMPHATVARGRLAKGFPAALAPLPGARVESSSLSVSGGTLQAALTATGGDPWAVIVHYRDALVARGYLEQATQGVENSPAAAFVKGTDSVTVTTVGGKTYLVAHLRPAHH